MNRRLPPRRAAAIPTFVTCQTPSAGHRDQAGSEEPEALRAATSSEPDADEYRDFGDHPRQNWRLILAVFLPFAAGYYLSFLFRTINASISPALASEFGLDAAKTGLLASVYFLVFAGVQIPIGVLLDRYGPRRVQSVLLVMAAGGAGPVGSATGFSGLPAARC